MRMIFRLAPDWLAIANYNAASDAATEAMAKVTTKAATARLTSDANEFNEHWVPRNVKGSTAATEPVPQQAAPYIAVPSTRCQTTRLTTSSAPMMLVLPAHIERAGAL